MATPIPTATKPAWVDDAKGFWAYIFTMFQGAFNDNVFRYIIVFMVTALLATEGETVVEQGSQLINSVGTVVLALPFILFAGVFGAISDRYSKKTVMVLSKFSEVAIMAFGIVVIYLQSVEALIVLLFLMGMQSALFGPPKYGILPEINSEARLSWANGYVQGFTMISTIAGTGIAGFLFREVFDGIDGPIYWAGVFLVGCSFAGFLASLRIPNPPPANPNRRITWNPAQGMAGYYRSIWRDPWLFVAVFNYTFFWFAAALMQQNVVSFGQATLQLSETQSGILLALLSGGIGLGAVLAGYISRNKIEIGLVPIGVFGMFVMCLALSLPWLGLVDGNYSYTTAAILLALLGFFGGIYDVPLAATIQKRSPQNAKGGTFAAVNLLTWIGILFAGVLNLVFSQIGVGVLGVFFIAAILCLIITLITVIYYPLYILRTGLWLASVSFFRLKILGRGHVPEEGGALLVSDYTSMLDVLALATSTDRSVRFVLSEEACQGRLAGLIAYGLQAIRIQDEDGLEQAEQALREGYAVCISAGCRLKLNGNTLSYKSVYERLARAAEVPVVPVHADHLMGNLFAILDGSVTWQMPNRIPWTVVVAFGAPLTHGASASEVRNKVQELDAVARISMKNKTRLLHRSFIKAARRHPFRTAMVDQRTPAINFFKALVGSIALGRAIKKKLGPEEMVGLLVPPSVGGALTNAAVHMMGKVPVNLNYTASEAAIQSSADQCGIKQVLTSKLFLEKMPIKVPGEAIFLEDIRKEVGSKERIIAMLMAVFFPVFMIERALGSRGKRGPDDLAAVIFSSGSSGDPKGVMLTQQNVSTNIESLLEAFPHSHEDCVLGILPFFHSFGFTGTLWLPMTHGLRVVFHPNPLEAKLIGDLVQEHGVSFIIATPTFLQSYIRRCQEDQFRSVRYVVTGAEKLPERIRLAFKDKFGVEPLEGYGTTECAPAVSVNLPDSELPGFFHPGTKHGTIGRPTPGIAVKVLDMDTGEQLFDETAGLLHVKGPNIMPGYLGREDLTREALHDGWYNTGDIAAIDDEGFITITDRLFRFSKLAGEMVPHVRVEEVLHDLMGFTEQTLAVSGVPDESKGEKLVVLHTLDETQVSTLKEKLRATKDLPNLWKPNANNFHRIDEIPVLGTGKMDLRAIKQMAKDRAGGE